MGSIRFSYIFHSLIIAAC